MDEHTRHAVRLMCDAAHEMRRQHELQTVLIDRLCALLDAEVEKAEQREPTREDGCQCLTPNAAGHVPGCLLWQPGKPLRVVG